MPTVVSEVMQCDLCKKKIKDVGAAVDAGWVPSHYPSLRHFDRDRVGGPICERCCEERCQWIEDEAVAMTFCE